MSHLKENARKYAAENEIELIKSLGHGTDGHVWSTNLDTAVKAFERETNYARELECYQRLAEKDVVQVSGFSVPSLVGHSDELLIVEMDIVSPPCVLDFGKAYVDDMPQQLNEMWRAEIETFEDIFEDNAYQAKVIIFALQQYGIFYFDAKPNNIKFD